MSPQTEDPRLQRLQHLLIPAAGMASGQSMSRPAPPPLPRRRRWRPELIGLNLWVALLGGWVIAAPWALHYPSGGDPRINDWACGGAVVILALVGATGWRQRYLAWTNAVIGLIGIWLAIAIITIDHVTAAKWSDFLFGFLIFLSSSALLGVAGPRREGEGNTLA